MSAATRSRACWSRSGASVTRSSAVAKRHRSGGLAIAAERDLLDPRLRRRQPRLALLLQPVALGVEVDRLVERRLAAFELPHDLLEPAQGGLEREFGNGGLFGCRGLKHGP